MRLAPFYARPVRIDHPRPARWFGPSGCAFFAAAVFGFARAATAETRPRGSADPFRDADILYEAPPGCSSRSDFEARMRAHAPSHDPGTSALRRIEARVEPQGRRVSASVTLTDETGSVTTRRIVAASCNEAVDALALIVALTLGPPEYVEKTDRASETERAPDAGTSAAPAASATSAPGGRETSNVLAPEKGPAAKRPSGVREAPHLRRSDGQSPAVHAGVSASLLVASGTAPAPQFGGEIAGSVVALTRPELSALGGARFVFPRTVSDPGGDATLSWWAGFAAICAGTRVASSALAVRGCAAYELGRLSASGNHTLNPASYDRIWQAAGPALRLEWELWLPLVVTAEVEGLIPFRRERFLFGESVAFAVPAVALRAGAGLEMRF